MSIGPMKVLITGSTGFVGTGVLRACLQDPRIDTVVSINRSPLNIVHPKLQEIIHANFYDLKPVEHLLVDIDACLYCLGSTSLRLSMYEYHQITHDLTLYIAQRLHVLNPNLTFVYISGMGADRAGKKHIMWTSIKGKIENTLLGLGLQQAYMVRPGLIRPIGDITSKNKLTNLIYKCIEPLRPFIKHTIYPRFFTTTENLGRAMAELAVNGYQKDIVENREINRLGAKT